MSSTSSVQLTEEQEKFLKSLDEEFKDRYTENDKEFKELLQRKLPLPPIVENWGDSWRRNYRYGSYLDFRDGGGKGGDGYSGRGDRRQHNRRQPY